MHLYEYSQANTRRNQRVGGKYFVITIMGKKDCEKVGYTRLKKELLAR